VAPAVAVVASKAQLARVRLVVLELAVKVTTAAVVFRPRQMAQLPQVVEVVAQVQPVDKAVAQKRI
jgi:hypothetical protein